MDTFGCCSHYVQCSEKGNCLFMGNEDYQGCYYRKNLDSGKIFYGSRKGIIKIVPKNQLPEHIYISCYDRYFKIAHLSRNGWSYPLKDAEKEELLEKLKVLEIPFEIQDDESKCIIEGDEVEPANSKVCFSFSEDGQKFSIANYNFFLIRKRYSDGIAKALQNKGINAKVELTGSYSRVTDYPQKRTIKSEESKEIKISDAPAKVQTSKEIVKEVYKQISLFDFVS